MEDEKSFLMKFLDRIVLLNLKYFYFIIVYIGLLYIISNQNTKLFLETHLCTTGDIVFNVLKSMPNVVLTSFIIYVLFGRGTEKLLKQAVLTPENILPRLKPEEIPKYIKGYMVRHHKLKVENSEAYWDIFEKKFLNIKEYHKDKFVFIELSGGPNDKGYRKLHITVQYQVFRPKIEKKLRFSCRLIGNPMEVIYDDRYTLSWIFVQNSVDKELPAGAFNLIYVSVEGEEKKTKKVEENSATNNKKSTEDNIETSTKEHIIFETEDLGDLHGKYIKYTFEVLQYSGHGFVSDHVRCLTNNYTISLNYAKAHDVSDIYTIEYFLSDGKLITLDTEKQAFRNISGWIAPKSGVAFSWANIPQKNNQKI